MVSNGRKSRQTAGGSRSRSFDPLDAADAATHVWLYDLEATTLSQFTFEVSVRSYGPVWTPDGQRVAFQFASRDRALGIYWKRADASEDMEVLLKETDPDSGDVYYYNSRTEETSWDRPHAKAAAGESEGEEPKPSLPEGWEQETDPDSGDVYYYNSETGETSWDRPGDKR